jgi:peptide/nickel transport system ATP-binding protein
MGPSSDSGELCSFRARCRMRIDGKCNITPPPLKRLPSGAEILCHHSAADLSRMQTTGTGTGTVAA